MAEKIEKNQKMVKDEEIEAKDKKAVFSLKVALVIVAMALISTITAIWFTFRGDVKNNEIAANTAIENGIVKGASTDSPEYLANLVDTLKKTGFVLYGMDSDPNTKRQKEIFGQAFSSLDYVECEPGHENSNPDECLARHIEKHPTWSVGEEKIPGYKTASELEEIIVNRK